MEFAFTEEQSMIREMAASFLETISPSETVRQAMATAEGFNPDDWQRICDQMCWQAITIPEQYGGLELGFVEQAIVMEEMGKTLLCSPYFSTSVLASNTLRLCGSEQQKQHWLPQLAAGQITATLALLSGCQLANRQWDTRSVQASFTKQEDGYLLTGTWHHVIDGHTSDLILLAAREQDSDQLQIFAVPSDQPGLECQWTPSMDQTRKLSRIVAKDLLLPLTSTLAEADSEEPLKQSLALAQIALAAEQTGGASQAMQSAIDYTMERKQFNRPVASFQALKHRAANMKLEVESAISALYFAACIADDWLADRVDNSELYRAASMAKAYCSETFTLCAHEAIQFHGGVGFTWEYDTHLYLKRAQSSESLLGAPALHRSRIADHLLDQRRPTPAVGVHV